MVLSMDDQGRRRRNARNWALGGILLGLVVIFYAVTVVRIGLTH